MGSPIGRRLRDKLTDRAVKAAKLAGYYGDGAGLYLQVSAAGTKSWIFRFTLRGRQREMGLGGFPDVSLAEAREKRDRARKLLADGVDPLEAKHEQRRTNSLAAARAVTFKADAEACIEANRAKWRNEKHAQQWANTLATYAYPVFGNHLVSEIDVPLVLRCLKPIWTTKTETASRLRARIEAVLNFAKASKHRTGDNPAAWKGNLEHLLPPPKKVAAVQHHAAVPFALIAPFMRALRDQSTTSARAVEFIILTATRTNEAFMARWSEVDLPGRIWTIPAQRMKADQEHRVPLSSAALQVLRTMAELGTDGFVFPGAKEGKPLSNMAGLQLLERMGYGNYTVHGFRSSFRDWAAEQTNFPNEVAEMALAHTIKNKAEAAYRRGDLFEKRARLMQAWADYCSRDAIPREVIPIRAKKA